MPASKKNKENLRKAVSQAYDEENAKNPDRMKKIARQRVNELKEQSAPKPKKSRAYNRAAAQKALAKLRAQKSK